ncbi:MAG: hypothetical protein ACYSYU_09050 [Planctomycetota bacterium]|jgi:hypothetical protein
MPKDISDDGKRMFNNLEMPKDISDDGKRMFNTIFAKNFYQKRVFRRKFDVWCLCNSSKLMSVETKRRQEFVEKS